MTSSCFIPAPAPGLTVSGRIDVRRAELTPAERAVASAVLGEPEAVAFGTVAQVARRAGVSGATVVRLATKEVTSRLCVSGDSADSL